MGLTRHCLASGRIQLPFALSDTFPEGDLLAHDVDHDELVVLESLPPRRLSGLREYFERNELEVNDVLEFRLAEGELRLACVRRTRRAPGEEEGARASSPVAEGRSAAGPTSGEDAAGSPGDRVIGRIGSVTVRRLGSGRFAPPPEAALRATGPAAPERSRPGVEAGAGDADRGDGSSGAPPREARGADAPALDDLPGPEAVDDLDALLDAAPAAPAESERERVGEADLIDEGSLRAHDRADGEAPVLRWFRRPGATVDGEPQRPRRAEPHRSQPRRSDPRPAEVEAPRAEAAVAVGRRAAEAPSAPARSEGDGAAGASRDAAAPAVAGDPVERQRAREEALSRAGDLRSRIVRWLLDPRTPVIVQHEHVQERFGLEASVARDVLAGIVVDPPPSLHLTAVREDVLRVSRVTVEHEG